MKVLAENHITVTKSLFMEGMLRISRDSYGKTARRAALVLLGLWVALLIFTLSVNGGLWQTTGILICVVFVSLWLLVVMPRSHAKKAWKAQESRYGSTMERTARFYDDHLQIQGDCLEKTVAYSEIQQIKYSRRLMILITQDRVGIMLALDGFGKQTAREAEAIILNKEMDT